MFVAQSGLILWPLDCSPPGSSVLGIFQARICKWVAISFSRWSSWPRDRTEVSCFAGRFFTIWATRKAISSVQFSCSVVWLFVTSWTAALLAFPSITNSWSLLKLVHLVGDATQPFILCHPLLLWPSIFPSIRVFSNELGLYIRWPKC